MKDWYRGDRLTLLRNLEEARMEYSDARFALINAPYDQRALTAARKFRGFGFAFLVCLAACSPTDVLTLGVSGSAYTEISDISYAAGDGHSLDIYQPATPAQGHPVVVFFFGGAWQHGSKEDVRFVAEPLAAAGITVVIPDYRLAPKVAFPAFIDDGAAATAWTRDHIAQYGGNPANLFVMGHSAGGYIAVMLAVNPAYLAKSGMRPGELAGAIGLAGPYNFLPITWPDLKPIFATAPDLAITQPITFADCKSPPLLLLAGAADTTVDPIKNTDALYHRIQDCHGAADERLYPDIGHIGIITAFAPLLEEKAPVLADTLAFIKAHAKTN